MKNLSIAFIVLAIIFSGCKSQKKLAQSPYTSDTTSDAKVFKVPDEKKEDTSNTKTVIFEKKKLTKDEVTKELEKKPVISKTEKFAYTEVKDKETNDANTYFVIVGSFLNLNNAQNFKQTLINQGFTPIILHSETGYYRVCVNSYQVEGDARSRVANIRANYPKYNDVWLLIKN